jgi:hypothetical protein
MNLPYNPNPESPDAPSGRSLALLAERADTLNWLDNFAAAPAPVAAGLGLRTAWLDPAGQLAAVKSAIPFSHFNMVLTLGCPAVADDAAFAAIDAFYAQGGCGKHWILVNGFSAPADLAAQLQARGYRHEMDWERVILLGARPSAWAPFAQGCELVTGANAADWSRFVCQAYGMPPPIAAWLDALAGRKGWIHAIRRAGGQADGPVVMARSLFMAEGGWAWLGIDAPVPGVMAPCFADDQLVTATLLVEAARQGARCFVSDIEAPDPARTGEAYARWGALGFEAAYLRQVYGRG